MLYNMTHIQRYVRLYSTEAEQTLAARAAVQARPGRTKYRENAAHRKVIARWREEQVIENNKM